MSDEEIKTQKIIIKFFTEIMVKGTAARRQMIRILYGNVQKLIKRISPDIELKKFFDKLEIVCPLEFVEEVKDLLINTPGVELVLEAKQFEKIDTIDQMKIIVNDLMKEEVKGKTFVIRAKRNGTHDFKSTDMEKEIGGFMLANNDTKGISLKNSDVVINLELIHNQLSLITKRYKGIGGFPLGSQSEILSLMSGGFDSTVASYLTMKRGIKTHFVFFNLGGIAHEIGVKQVSLYLWNKFGSSHRVSFTSIPFEDVVTEIFKSTHESYMGVILKRLMIKAAEKIADEMKIDALVTGESIAQVSSQTLRNLALINESTNKLVLRPLATMHKPEIIDIATKIGTKHFAVDMPEYCGVISKNPVSHGSYERVEKEASRFDYSILDKAVQNAVKINVDEIAQDIEEIGMIETVSDVSNKDYTIIDIRQEDSCIEASCEVLKIPFYNLKREFKKLPSNKEYLFYCDKGILSQLHAQYLRDSQNYQNIKVYRPKSL